MGRSARRVPVTGRAGPGRGYFDPYEPWQLDTIVDVVVISDQVKMREPEPAIFELTVDKLGVPPAMGMHVIHHTDSAVAVAALADLFAVPLPVA